MPRQQKPPIGETQTIKVSRGPWKPDEEREEATILYKREEDGWYVLTPGVEEWFRFATADARDRDVRQLINKKWNYLYGDPDDLDDRS